MSTAIHRHIAAETYPDCTIHSLQTLLRVLCCCQVSRGEADDSWSSTHALAHMICARIHMLIVHIYIYMLVGGAA